MLVFLWYYQSFEMLCTCLDGYRQGSFYRLQLSVKTKFADKHVLIKQVGMHLFIGSEYGNSKREVEAGAFLS